MSRRKAFDTDKTLEKIMLLFWQQGYYQTSLEDIVKTSGVKKQSLYNAFGDKRTIFLRTLHIYYDMKIGERIQFLETKEAQNTSKIETLKQFLTWNQNDDDLPQGCMLVNTINEFSNNDSEIANEAQTMFRDYITLIANVVSQGQKNGEITNTKSSYELAEILMNARNGIQVTRRMQMQSEQILTMSNNLLDLIKA
ncbi:cell surface protein [Bacillus anthracis]|uniref:TetR/AcrR family transcriptional regulator n=1 Tax=Bacillus cereus TaxID=1396 RepID=A0AAN5XJQ2_BACCE|nr:MULTISPECIES: TetR/AcrR family transcriptional regulator [Bacillus]PED52318.1 cell surface protein [Bacillus anthracis]KAB2446133.1 TetR/AcrR family transcriptional regulator [Bacillus cereus]PEF62690.1 cell surface protein [Bacillus anthracis]PEV21388.1 cell surface protein [Bacillus thuringiensis]PEZ59277.1 cell surface protein [Bacillus anthracis]